MDPALDLKGPIQRDDFDLMAGNFMLYVQAALVEELTNMNEAGKGSRTRLLQLVCPIN